jgi:hypothetical protein
MNLIIANKVDGNADRYFIRLADHQADVEGHLNAPSLGENIPRMKFLL